MSERESIINFLLQACDAKNAVIAEQQKKIAELEKAAAPKSE
jgi:hypothetical protein